MSRGEGRFRLAAHHFAQAAADAVALHRVADLLRDREADADRCRFGVLTAQRLQHEWLRRRAGAGLGDGPKVRPAFQALHEIGFWVGPVSLAKARARSAMA